MAKTILVVGQYINHVVGSKVELCKKMELRVAAFETDGWWSLRDVYKADSSYVFDSAPKAKKGTTRLASSLREVAEVGRSLGLVREEQGKDEFVRSVLAESRPDLVWGVWGEAALMWLRTILRVGYRGPVMWTANVFPNRITNLRRLTFSAEGVLYWKWLRRMDAILTTNDRMGQYMTARYSAVKKSRLLNFPDFMPGAWYARDPQALQERSDPHVVFLGSPNRYGQRIDEVDSEIKEIAGQGVHVHLARPVGIAISSPFIHYYDMFPDISFKEGEFGQSLNQFDAAIVFYNFKGKHPRFSSTYPTRLVSSLCGCIPVFVKRGPLTACEELVEGKGIGTSYKDAGDLARQLKTRVLLESFRKAAKWNAERFACDNEVNIRALKGMIDELLASRRR